MKYLNFTKLWVGLFFCCGLLTVKSASAQQEVFYSQYMFNTMAINPAYAGSRDVLSVTALGRYQWIGVPGAPTTYSLTLDMPFQNEKMGVGLTGYNDQIGEYKTTGVNLAYSYKFKLTERTTMSLGLQPSFTNVNANLLDVKNMQDPGDPAFADNLSRTIFNAGLGTFISNDRAYFGFSVPQLIEQRLSPNPDSEGKIQRHYFAMMGFVLGKGNVKLKPSTVIRMTKGAPMGLDANLNLWYRDIIAFGVSGRKSQMVFSGTDQMDAVVLMLELQLTPQLRIGTAYDYSFGKLNANYSDQNFWKNVSGTPTFEGFLRYEFGFGKDKIITPRYF
jgi:type IX secretion system PorP/SprF family membrane protein